MAAGYVEEIRWGVLRLPSVISVCQGLLVCRTYQRAGLPTKAARCRCFASSGMRNNAVWHLSHYHVLGGSANHKVHHNDDGQHHDGQDRDGNQVASYMSEVFGR